MSARRKGNLTITLVCILIFFATGVANAQQVDDFNSDATVVIQFQGQPPMTIKAKGPTTVERRPQQDGSEVTEITGMRLISGGGITITKRRERRSMGRISPPLPGVNRVMRQAEFQVFTEIQTPFGTFFNDVPIPLATVIDDNLPPLSNTYEFVGSIPLRGPRPANILQVSHHPSVPGSPGGTPRAVLSPYLVGVWQLRDFPNFFSPSREDTLFTIINPTAVPLAVQVKILDDRENAIACGRVRPPLTPSDMVEVNVRQFLVLNGVPIPPTQVGVVQAVSFLPPGPPQNLLKTGIVGYLKNFITDGGDPEDTLSPFDRALNVISHAKEELKPVPDKDLNLREFLTCPPGRTFDIPSHPTGSSKTKDGSSTGVAMKQDVESHKVKSEAKIETSKEQ